MEEGKKPFREKLKNEYRLVILNDDTLQEEGQYKLSLQNLYMLLSAFVLILGFLVVSAIVFTPLKRLIPGYGDVEDNQVLIEINKNLTEIEQIIDAQSAYMSSFRKMLTADEVEGLEQESDVKSLKSTLDKVDSLNSNRLLKNPVGLIKAKQKRNPNSFYFIPPVNGLVGSKFDLKKEHIGVDILAPENSAINAIADGHIIVSDWNLDAGNTIGIQHSDNMLSFYKHNSALLKEEGAFVRAGEAIAIIGNSGTLTDGPHLHFELWFDGTVVDPLDYIDF